MIIMPDGSVVSSGVKLPQNRTTEAVSNRSSGILECKVNETLYIDDDRNTTKGLDVPRLQYNLVVISSGNHQGNILYNVMDESQGGGINDNSETVRTADPDYQPDGDYSKNYLRSSGDMVIVSFSGIRPIITGSKSHPKNKSSATKAKGVTHTEEFNGIKTSVDKFGTHTIENVGGPQNASGVRSTPLAIGSKMQITKDGAMGMVRGQQKMVMDRLGAINLKGPGDNAMTMAQGGAMKIKSQTMNIAPKQALNIKSQLTKIGNSGTQSARVGDMVVGTGNQGGPVMSKIINGSFLSLVGS